MRRCLSGKELHDAIAQVLARHLDTRTERAWIIGSEASGHAVPGSDIDVALEGRERIDLADLARIRDELEQLPTLRSFDLIDLRRTTERFRAEALRTALALELGEPRGDAHQGLGVAPGSRARGRRSG